MKQQKYQKFQKICQEHDWKCTAQRIAVYEAVCDNLRHPGVDELWRQIKKDLPSVTRESVYRILNEFAEQGILQRLDRIGSARYDSQTGPHGHFICERCGAITDFQFPEQTVLPVAQVPGKLRHIELRVSIICDNCDAAHPVKQPRGEES